MPKINPKIPVLAFALACLGIYTLRSRHPSYLDYGVVAEELVTFNNVPHTFSWDEASSSKAFNWKPCYENRECARLLVPLDYDEPEGRQASIAIVRKKAGVPSTSSTYKGPVLFNPGGLVEVGSTCSRLSDSTLEVIPPTNDNRKAKLIFVPGIARSTPLASFFKEGVQRALFSEHETGRWMKGHRGVAQAWARANVVNQLAGETDDGYLEHIRTDNTARDMLSINEAYGRDKVQYWGFSYGSVLGATFAAMFPDRVERLVIDGVMDAEDYYATLWSQNLLDTNKSLETFFTGCAEAGPENCPFWTADPSDMRQNLTNLYHNLAANPIPVVEGGLFGVIDDTHIRSAVFLSLYAPYARFPTLAKALADPVKHAKTLLQMSTDPPFSCACGSDESASEEGVSEGVVAVSCNDGVAVPRGDLKSLIEFYDDFNKRSEWGRLWSHGRLRCSGWPRHASKRFQGPFNANTSHPILLVGNTADPVTPLHAAKKMSKGFTNSVVLTQDSPGHCSIAAPSVCSQQHIRNYFLDGTLPPPETVCSVDSKPFPSAPDSNRKDAPVDQNVFSTQTERVIYEAIDALSKMPVVRRHV